MAVRAVDMRRADGDQVIHLARTTSLPGKGWAGQLIQQHKFELPQAVYDKRPCNITPNRLGLGSKRRSGLASWIGRNQKPGELLSGPGTRQTKTPLQEVSARAVSQIDSKVITILVSGTRTAEELPTCPDIHPHLEPKAVSRDGVCRARHCDLGHLKDEFVACADRYIWHATKGTRDHAGNVCCCGILNLADRTDPAEWRLAVQRRI